MNLVEQTFQCYINVPKTNVTQWPSVFIGILPYMGMLAILGHVTTIINFEHKVSTNYHFHDLSLILSSIGPVISGLRFENVDRQTTVIGILLAPVSLKLWYTD